MDPHAFLPSPGSTRCAVPGCGSPRLAMIHVLPAELQKFLDGSAADADPAATPGPDIWNDDDGVWRKIGERTYGPFFNEEEAERFEPITPFPREPAFGSPEAVKQATETIRDYAGKLAQVPSRADLLDEVKRLRAELAEVTDRDTAAFRAGSATLKEAQEVIKRLGAEKDAARLDHECSEGTLAMAVARLGGQVEGAPTHRVNFLQRIDELRRVEQQRDALADALLALVVSRNVARTGSSQPGDPSSAEWAAAFAALKLAGRLLP